MCILSYPLQVAFLFSIIFAVEDFINHEVSSMVFLAYFIVGIIVSTVSERKSTDVMLSSLPGIIFLILSFTLKGQVGTGDGLYLLLTSLYLGISQMVFILVISLIMSGMVSLLLVLTGKAKTLPYLSFIPLPLLLLITGRII